MTRPRWRQRPEGSNWGDFGPDDQLGRLNLLGTDAVRRGVAEVREGQAFALSLPLDYPGGSDLNPNRRPPVLRPLQRKGRVNFNCRLGELDPGRTDVLSDDMVILSLQYSTQWDGLAHVGSMFDADGDGVPEAVYYNGFKAGEHLVGPDSIEDTGVPPEPAAARSTSAAQALGIEGMARSCVQGRGTMVDLRAHYGDGRTVVGYDELMRVHAQAAGRQEAALGLRRPGRTRPEAAAVDHRHAHRRHRGRQLCGRRLSRSSGSAMLRGPSARALPVQAGCAPR